MPPGNEFPAREPHRPQSAHLEMTSAKYLPPDADDTSEARQRIRDLETAPGELVFSVLAGVTGIALFAIAVFVADLAGSERAVVNGSPTPLAIARWVIAMLLCGIGLYLFWRFLPRVFRFWYNFIS